MEDVVLTGSPAPAASDARVVLVVGASSGIGRAAASILARAGHVVFGTSRDAARVDAPGVAGLSLEAGDEASVQHCVEQVLARMGRIDALIYSAGFYVAGAVEETPPELASAQLDAYLLGPHRVVRAVLPAMRARRTGRIVFVTSSGAVAPIPFHPLYSASKAALHHYAEGLRYEVGRFGIDVSLIEGTSVQTSAAAAAQSGAPIAAYEPYRRRVVERFRDMQREGPPPTAIARAAARAATARRPRTHYRVGLLAKSVVWLRAALPNWLFFRVFSIYWGV